MSEVAFEAGPDGQIDGHFRERSLPLDLLKARFPAAELPKSVVANCQSEPERTVAVVEAVLPSDGGFAYYALLVEDPTRPTALATGHFGCSPFISFRWLKGAGEIYGRSPVMSALPDIKTANKVVELILKNASIAVTGIWLADDDGVLNPANIRLVPGSIIPKAVGSSGLTPLQAPGRFDVSNLVLEDLRAQDPPYLAGRSAGTGRRSSDDRDRGGRAQRGDRPPARRDLRSAADRADHSTVDPVRSRS